MSKLLKKGRFFFLNFLRQNFNSNQYQRQRSSRQRKKTFLTPAGFVLPTTILVLLVVGLFAGALIARTGDRAENVIRDQESQRIDNIAAPAVERAKAKLEFLFNRDPRFPTGVPTQKLLRDLMLYIDTPDVNLIPDGNASDKPDPYTLIVNESNPSDPENEERIDIDGDGTVDNAWKYETDLDGDGTKEVVAYSILTLNGIDQDGDGKIQFDPNASTPDITLSSSDQDKADNLVTRTGPLSIDSSKGISSDCEIPTLKAEEGWFAVNATSLRKNFQVNVFVENKNDANKTVAALEFQQDRQLDRGNKFGVWFRYDTRIVRTPPFRLNGSIHTDGNLLIAPFSPSFDITFFLVSSPASCIYNESSNIIELTEERDDNGVITFQGQAIHSNSDVFGLSGQSPVHLFGEEGPLGANGNPLNSTNAANLSSSTDSLQEVINDSTLIEDEVIKYTLDPVALYTRDKLVSRGNQNADGSYDTSARDSNWNNIEVSKRIRNEVQRKPYVDDLYRADSRWGPKPKYGKEAEVTIADLTNGFDKNGELIKDNAPSGLNVDTLIGLNPPDDFPEEVGLDGYWERRSYTQGLRVIVGQRLELGNPFGWEANGDDPLNPADNSFTPPSSMNNRNNEYRQQRTLRDNLAAVQATAVYHYNDDNDEGVGDFPVATLATTAHPGTLQTIANSTTFDRTTVDLDGDGNNDVLTNFLEGQGTNGWEFNPPGNVTTDTDFENLVDQTTDPLRRALTNLAYFAGDPDGAFPPKQENSGDIVHPYPQLTMWGDYSNLRRVIDQLDGGTSYSDLSLADKTTLQTASATLGMLAYNIKFVNETYKNLPDTGSAGLNALGNTIITLMDGDPSNGEMGDDPSDLCESGDSLGDPGCPPAPYDPAYYTQFTP
ncbi:MAG: hypothetical protein GVY17_02135, partial [Cyanobacteria bacterium]|nr:hypothetical protein [Cyanobacteria bacterium GSL.Bin21]